jgi:hypothetical protein
MMNRYKISSEGELFTGCIRKFHKFHKFHKKKQPDVSEAVRRECRELRSKFFRQVLKIANSFLDEDSNPSQAVAHASHHDTEIDKPALSEDDLEPTETHSFGEGSSQDARESIAGLRGRCYCVRPPGDARNNTMDNIRRILMSLFKVVHMHHIVYSI